MTDVQRLASSAVSRVLAGRSLEQAQARYGLAVSRLEAGLGTHLDVLTASAAAGDARLALERARGDWLLAVWGLEHELGGTQGGDR